MNDWETKATYWEEQSSYAWALLNGCCDEETQKEFDNLALVPMDEHDGYAPIRARQSSKVDRSFSNA